MYDKTEDVENKLLSARAKKATVEAEGITADNIYRILLQFDKLHDQWFGCQRDYSGFTEVL